MGTLIFQDSYLEISKIKLARTNDCKYNLKIKPECLQLSIIIKVQNNNTNSEYIYNGQSSDYEIDIVYKNFT